MDQNQQIGIFDNDIIRSNGYLYTNKTKLSCCLSNHRIQDALLNLVELKAKKIIDLGCGDGTFTQTLLIKNPDFVLGVDLAVQAIKYARKKYSSLAFKIMDIYDLKFSKHYFDVAVLRGVLHHLHHPDKVIFNACHIAKSVIVIESNGYNPMVKLIEKISPYHRQHQEKSYPPYQLKSWFEKSGAKLIHSDYIGLVPIFCPDWMAVRLKRLEPLMERSLIKGLICGQYAAAFQS